MIRPDTVSDLNAINLKLINTFVCVATCGSFHGAAAALGRSQSAISLQIRELEAQLGTALFLRTTRHLELTKAGQLLLEHGRTAITDLSMTFRHIQEEVDFRQGHVRVACSPTYAAARLPPIIKAFKAKFKGVKVSIGEYKSAEILIAIKEGRADFGVGPELSDPDMTFQDGLAEPLLAVVPEALCADAREDGTIALADVLRHPLVMFYPNTVVYGIVARAAEERGLGFSVEYSCIQGETLVAFANSGLAVAVLTASIANLSLVRECRILRIVEPEMRRKFTMITRKGVPLPPAARHLYNLLAADLAE